MNQGGRDRVRSLACQGSILLGSKIRLDIRSHTAEFRTTIKGKMMVFTLEMISIEAQDLTQGATLNGVPIQSESKTSPLLIISY
jgi:hypothetical protein